MDPFTFLHQGRLTTEGRPPACLCSTPPCAATRHVGALRFCRVSSRNRLVPRPACQDQRCGAVREGSRGGRASERRSCGRGRSSWSHVSSCTLGLAGGRTSLRPAVLLRFGQGSRPLLGLGAPPPPRSPGPRKPQEGGEEQRLAKLHAIACCRAARAVKGSELRRGKWQCCGLAAQRGLR